MCIRDRYNGTEKVRYNVWANNAVDSFSINYTKRPDLINVDGDKIMLWTKKDNKTLDNYIHQYKYAGKLSLIHISEPTRLLSISYAVFCLKKKKHINKTNYWEPITHIKRNQTEIAGHKNGGT